MKTLKIIGLLFLIVGIACVAAAFIWGVVDPGAWDALGPFFVGLFLLAIDLLGLIALLIYRVILKRTRLRG